MPKTIFLLILTAAAAKCASATHGVVVFAARDIQAKYIRKLI